MSFISPSLPETVPQQLFRRLRNQPSGQLTRRAGIGTGKLSFYHNLASRGNSKVEDLKARQETHASGNLNFYFSTRVARLRNPA
jgi:hypothetical protein